MPQQDPASRPPRAVYSVWQLPVVRQLRVLVRISPRSYSCGVKVDKQVSCDGGTTWIDEGLIVNNGDGTEACKGLSTDQIKVRYQAQNTGTGCALTGCTWEESNNAFGQPAEPFDIADGATTNLTTPASALCTTAFGDPQNPNEPDSIDISCNTAVWWHGRSERHGWFCMPDGGREG